MVSNKPQTADGYDPEHTLACERALVTLLRGFGTLKETLRLVGGLVPRYLTPESPPEVPAHAGTSDVDIVLNLQVLANDDTYADLADQLKARGFERFVKDGQPSSWRWQRKVSEHESVLVEFLKDSDEKSESGRIASVKGEGLSALAIDHVGIVHRWYLQRDVTAELLDDGGTATETVRFANMTAFIVLKTLAFEQRAENKDAADLIHVLRYANAGNVEAAVQEFVQYHRAKDNHDALDKTLAILHRRFCDGDGVEGYLRDGPKACAVFMYGRDASLEEERVLEQRNVSGLVSFFVKKVHEGMSDPQ
ncbi:hypothetical protein [Paraburkholderia sp.]|jgi:hypothetical protein|uniref:hypothetical protein n=1 Tax=Paraburkholderia sp. TaxID=1926495 RepID=UPI0026349BBB|nr:hypothetical protein [Paraburkholderia sp.]